MQGKNGWGLTETIIGICVIMSFVLLVVMLVNDLYANFPTETESAISNTSTNNYKQIENNLYKAANKYYLKYKNSLTNGNVITSEILINEYYLDKEDMMVNTDECTGYALVYNDSLKTYISCDNYETEGY